MRKIIWCGLGLTVAALILGMSVWSQSQRLVQAQTGVEKAEDIASGSGMLGVLYKQDYYLVYPGILPDHPLYFVKMMRDRVRLWIAGSGEERLRLELLYADKRLGAALVLAEGGRTGLAVETAVKAEQYLSATVDHFLEMNERDEEWGQTLLRATFKHEEVLRKLRELGDDGVKTTLSGLLDEVLADRSRIEEYLVREDLMKVREIDNEEKVIEEDGLEPRL